ncbi:MAG: N-formylglutamate amidohydrolase [Rhodospirillaceae bacterium]|nr:N-formylglutamate amidohydrolase [Rhodospirillaceae bacterium]
MQPIKTLNGILRVFQSEGIEAPLVFDSPHSGIYHPIDFVTEATPDQLATARDAFVDELILDCSSLGIAVLLSDFPRTYIDPNRSLEELDPAMLDGPWPEPLANTRKVRAGMGLIRRYILPGIEMYSKKLTIDEVERRISSYWKPYHDTLEQLVEQAYSSFGAVWYINWHSMKSIGNKMNIDNGCQRPDFVVSDRDGDTSSKEFQMEVVGTLRELGYEVALNEPYKGAELIKRHGLPDRKRYALQIEINRRLYLDERSVEKTKGFEILKTNIFNVGRHLVEYATS